MRQATLWLWLAVGCAPQEMVPTEDDDTPIEAYDPLDLVDPMVGTGGEGAQIANVNPGASWPVGMTLVGPDTRRDAGAPSFYHCAGYWWHDDRVRGFSHTHAHGMGVPDYGTIAYMPRDGWRPEYTREFPRLAPLDHALEEARPGTYRVTLPDDGTLVEIAATEHGAHSRLTFAEGAEPVVIWDMAHIVPDGQVLQARVSWAPGDPVMTGSQLASGSYSRRFGGLDQHFRVVFDPAPSGGGGWVDPDLPEPGRTEVDGPTSGVWLTFPEGTRTVHVRLAMSYVDQEGARRNLEAELPDTDFDARVEAVEEAWRGLLGRVRVRGGTDDERVIFHTAMYHALLFPSRQDDVDGRYRGVDQEVHTADGPHYSDLSMWDTFRTVHPWYTLAWPELQEHVLRSLVRMTEDGGYLPKWPLAHGYTGGMVGTPAAQVIAGSYLKGLTDFDVQTVFDAAYMAATTPVPQAGRGSVTSYVERGWLSMEEEGGSVSKTLEYAWNDHSLALLARALGRPEAEALERAAGSWRNTWNADAGFNTGRDASGTFVWSGLPFAWSGEFVEGNAWHYVWYVPYDVDGMIELQHGGDRDAFAERVRTYWEAVQLEPDDLFPDDYYWHGNEPVMHYAFLGSLMGRPDLTSEAARWVMSHRYAATPLGLDGNDDAGTLSAWYLLASVGLFPVAGTVDYAWSPALFERVEIARTPTDTLVIRAPGASAERAWFSGWDVDGEPLDGTTLTHDRLVGNRTLNVRLADAPGAWE